MAKRWWRNFDFILFGCTIALIILGVALIHSAEYKEPDGNIVLTEMFYFRQLVFAGIGIVAMFIVAVIDYRLLTSLQRFVYIVTVGTLGGIFFVGQATHGSVRWLTEGSIQPSELTKVLLILVLAKYLADHDGQLSNLRYLLISLFIAAVPIGLIYLQPDLGTALTLAVIWFGMVFMAGLSFVQVGFMGVLGIATAPFVWLQLEDYMRERVYNFLFPERDLSGAGFNIRQALISIGSGGLVGKGLGNGSQSQLHFLRVRHADFIFSVLGEELGFLGAILLFALFIVIISRILRAASLAKDGFGRYICCGVATLIFFQMFVNVAVNMSLLPATGIPLPFVSYGGSALVTFLIAEGLVQSVVMRHKKIEFN